MNRLFIVRACVISATNDGSRIFILTMDSRTPIQTIIDIVKTTMERLGYDVDSYQHFDVNTAVSTPNHVNCVEIP